MSTIKLNGASSGSSIIKAPDSGSTNQTFTLPASTGTLVTTTTAVTKDASGNVGIGVTPESWNSSLTALQIGETGAISGGDTGWGGYLEIGSNFYRDSGGFKYTTADKAVLTEYDNSNGRINHKVAASGSADAAITLLTRGTFDADGLKFNGDTAAANALDDYEEGSWNPAYTAHQGSIGSTDYGEWEGYYTKIGRLVTCQFKVTLSNKGSWSGEVRLTGLPFSVQVTLPAVGSVRLANVDIPNDASNHDVYVTAGVTYFRIYYTQDDAASSFVQASQVENTSVFAGTMSYITVA